MSQWYTLINEEIQGPRTYREVLLMRQNRELSDYSLVWTPGLLEWTPIGALRDFCAERVQEVLSQAPENTFQSRRVPRVQIQIPAWIHDNESVWPGRAVSLSVGGAGLSVQHSGLQPGQELTLHLKNRDDRWAITAQAEVLSKGFREHVEKAHGVLFYTLKFKENSLERSQTLERTILK